MSQSNTELKNLGGSQKANAFKAATIDSPTRKTSRLAIASMSCSVLAVFCLVLLFLFDFDIFGQAATVLLPAAFVLGIIACFAIVRHKHLKGYAYAIIAIIVGGAFVLLMAQTQFTIRMRAYYEKTNTSRYNLRKLGKAMHEYAQDHDGYLPVANQWCDLLLEYDKSLTRDDFKHPKREGTSIAFNKYLDVLRLADIPGNVVLLFEAEGGWNLTGGAELLSIEHFDGGYVNVLLLNKEIKTYWINEGGVRQYGSVFTPLRWKP